MYEVVGIYTDGYNARLRDIILGCHDTRDNNKSQEVLERKVILMYRPAKSGHATMSAK